MSTLSVAEIAKLIVREDETLSAARDRVRHWAVLGFLIPSGAKNPGTGRSIMFPQEMAKRAMMLEAFVCAGFLATRAVKIIDRCPDITRGRATIRLGPSLSITIDGREICGAAQVRHV